MREILFRGKIRNGGQWLEGSFKSEIVINENVVEVATIVHKGTAFEFPVDPETVGQYTGLTDKNGKRIFEGDILKDDWGKIYTVIFTTISCGFLVECTVAPNEYDKGRYRLGDAWCDTISVIGTIHDNPELLEKKTNG